MTMSATDATVNTVPIDETIGQLEKIYKSVTGKGAPTADTLYAPIPAEKDPARHVEEQMDRLLQMLESTGTGQGVSTAPPWSPPISVWEDDSEVLLCVDLPGVSRDAVEVRLQGNLLIISGSKASTPASGTQLRLNERPLGPFRRTVVLPPAVQSADPQALMRDGVLEIRIRKEPAWAAATKSIPVN